VFGKTVYAKALFRGILHADCLPLFICEKDASNLDKKGTTVPDKI